MKFNDILCILYFVNSMFLCRLCNRSHDTVLLVEETSLVEDQQKTKDLLQVADKLERDSKSQR
jgi:hypothetical protein